MNIPFVNLKAQYNEIKDEILNAVQEVIESSAFINGKYVKAFEEDFADYCGAKHCIGVGNGTDALYIALKTLGVGPGDEVITAANSFIATSEAITSAGAKVVFVDCDETTYNIDIDLIEEKITPKTKAIIPVCLFGQPVQLEEMFVLADKYGLKVVMDAAQAHGSTYNGKPMGAFSDFTCFSFYPGKNLGAYGDAGAILSNDYELAKRSRMFANHGRMDKYNHKIEGVNSRMDGIQGAVLRVKLKHLEKWIQNRRIAADFYRLHLKGDIITPRESPNVKHVYHLFVVRVPERAELQARLKEKGISTGIHYPIALPFLEAYSYLGHDQADFPAAAKLSEEILSLPICGSITKEQLEYVAANVNDFYK